MGTEYNVKSIVRNGLVLHLDAANVKSYPGSGTTWFDMSGNNNNATLSNTVYGTKEFLFNGANSIASIVDSNALSFTNNIFTFECVVYFNDLVSNNGLFSKTTGGWEYSVFPSTSTTIYFNSWNLSGSDVYSSHYVAPISFLSGKYYHFVWVANGSSLITYVNGNILGTAATKSALNMQNGPGNLVIGAGGNASGLKYLNGKMSIFRIYNNALTAQSVSQNFNALRGRYGL